jgi:antitoxin component YwqK of YwqJK toxin-antitoxin module
LKFLICNFQILPIAHFLFLCTTNKHISSPFEQINMSIEYVYKGSFPKHNNNNKDQTEKIYYKILSPDWTCLNYQYQLGKTYVMPETSLVLCRSGFHCCEHPVECLLFRDLDPFNHYVEVKMLGKIASSKLVDDPKHATNILKIEREIPYEEWLELCTVNIRDSRFPRYYVEKDWIKGKVSERREFPRKGEPFSRSISYFPNGREKSVQVQSDACSKKYNCIAYHENGIVRLTEEWVWSERDGEGRGLECIRNSYDDNYRGHHYHPDS